MQGATTLKTVSGGHGGNGTSYSGGGAGGYGNNSSSSVDRKGTDAGNLGRESSN